VAALAGVRVRSVAAGDMRTFALCWDGRVYLWGKNRYGQLGHGDTLERCAPTLLEGLEGVRGVAVGIGQNFAVTDLPLGPCSLG
jgi:alpha-tubulin suppressor-like RCC1 family protein